MPGIARVLSCMKMGSKRLVTLILEVIIQYVQTILNSVPG
jgi:hypothetical protein